MAYGARALWPRSPRSSPSRGKPGTWRRRAGDSRPTDRKVLVMRTAETVLNVIRDRGERGLPLEDIYRQLYNRNLYLRAYGRLYRNAGAMTQGTTAETVDGMSLAKIDAIIEALRYERYRWTPVRRVHIPKSNGKTRPLGIPTWSDKLLQEVIRLVLEAYYEPQFSDRSHGFRPNRGCHTALSEVARGWTGTRWFIEGDIKGCFDNIDHEVLLSLLAERLHDNRFLRLLRGLLSAGYLEDWRYGRTLSGTPQGGVISPILANVYLDRLDQYVETVLIPAHTKGDKRRVNPAWEAARRRMVRQRDQGNYAETARLRQEMQQLPSRDPQDPNYRRLRYVRYADDFVLGFSGPKAEAEAVKQALERFLSATLKLELSRQKTLITHATSQAARFLGYELVNQQANDKHDRNGRRKVNGRIGLRVPARVIEQHCRAYMERGKPASREPLPGGVPRRGAVLPAGLQRLPLREAAMGHEPIAGQDLGQQAQDHRSKSVPPLSRHCANRARGTCLHQGRRRTRRWSAPAGSSVRRHSTQTPAPSSPHRPTPPAIPVGPQRVVAAAARREVRTVRVNGGHPSPPRPRTPRPQHPGTSGKASMDAHHGRAPAQDPCGLPVLPQRHPRRQTSTATAERITREPDALKGARPVRRGADGKVLQQE